MARAASASYFPSKRARVGSRKKETPARYTAPPLFSRGRRGEGEREEHSAKHSAREKEREREREREREGEEHGPRSC